MSDSSQRKLECGRCFLPQGQKEEIIIKVIKFSPLIPYRNIWRLVRKNCICIVWLNGLISSWILFTSELVWLASSVGPFNITDQISHLMMLFSIPRPLWFNYLASYETAGKHYSTPTLTVVLTYEANEITVEPLFSGQPQGTSKRLPNGDWPLKRGLHKKSIILSINITLFWNKHPAGVALLVHNQLSPISDSTISFIILLKQSQTK